MSLMLGECQDTSYVVVFRRFLFFREITYDMATCGISFALETLSLVVNVEREHSP